MANITTNTTAYIDSNIAANTSAYIDANIATNTTMDTAMNIKKIPITTDFIKLQDLLKLAGLVSTGGEAKQSIQSGQVLVNNTPCLARGKKIRPEDTVIFQGQSMQVIYAT